MSIVALGPWRTDPIPASLPRQRLCLERRARHNTATTSKPELLDHRKPVPRRCRTHPPEDQLGLACPLFPSIAAGSPVLARSRYDCALLIWVVSASTVFVIESSALSLKASISSIVA